MQEKTVAIFKSLLDGYKEMAVCEKKVALFQKIVAEHQIRLAGIKEQILKQARTILESAL